MFRSFFNISKFNFKLFHKLLPNQNNIILDYGCGNGVYSKNYRSSKVKKILLYDKNRKIKKFIKKKYKNNQNIFWLDKLDSNYNIVLINSVIQYMNNNELKILIKFFIEKKVKKIIISDIPKYPRIVESIFLIFLNPRKLLFGLKYLFNQSYRKTDFYVREANCIKKMGFDYLCKITKNLNEEDFLRYSIVLKPKY